LTLVKSYLSQFLGQRPFHTLFDEMPFSRSPSGISETKKNLWAKIDCQRIELQPRHREEPVKVKYPPRMTRSQSEVVQISPRCKRPRSAVLKRRKTARSYRTKLNNRNEEDSSPYHDYDNEPRLHDLRKHDAQPVDHLKNKILRAQIKALEGDFKRLTERHINFVTLGNPTRKQDTITEMKDMKRDLVTSTITECSKSGKEMFAMVTRLSNRADRLSMKLQERNRTIAELESSLAVSNTRRIKEKEIKMNEIVNLREKSSAKIESNRAVVEKMWRNAHARMKELLPIPDPPNGKLSADDVDQSLRKMIIMTQDEIKKCRQEATDAKHQASVHVLNEEYLTQNMKMAQLDMSQSRRRINSLCENIDFWKARYNSLKDGFERVNQKFKIPHQYGMLRKYADAVTEVFEQHNEETKSRELS